MTRRPHVVIIGGGFGGLAAARELAHAPVQITLLDRRNHHLFQPLLYQVATAALSASDIAYPIRSILSRQKNVRVLLGEASAINTATRTVILDHGTLEYDYLILATGATHSYFGKDWAAIAPGLKSVEDALEIRHRIYVAYEAAERAADPVEQREWLTFVVVGGGPTGVELAGALAEIGLYTLKNDFRSIDPQHVTVILFEGTDRVLGSYPPKLSELARRDLEERGVTVRLNTIVTNIDGTCVTVRSGDHEERVATHTVLWAAGVQASPLAATLDAPRDRAGRVMVAPDLSVPGHPEIFVIGDLAHVENDGKMIPGVAQGAIQGGEHVAKIIEREVTGDGDPAARLRPPFRYRDKGNMATIGRASAIVETKRVQLHGLMAWLLWWVVHIMFLVGFRNRLLVMLQWAWSWLSPARGSRLITGPVGPLPPVKGIAPDGQPALPHAADPVALAAAARADEPQHIHADPGPR